MQAFHALKMHGKRTPKHGDETRERSIIITCHIRPSLPKYGDTPGRSIFFQECNQNFVFFFGGEQTVEDACQSLFSTGKTQNPLTDDLLSYYS